MSPPEKRCFINAKENKEYKFFYVILCHKYYRLFFFSDKSLLSLCVS